MSSIAPAQPRQEDLVNLENSGLIDRYAQGIDRIEKRLLDLNESQLDTFFRPEAGVGRWSCRVLVGHVADAEIVFAHRFRRTVAEERPVLAAWDENAFLDAGLYGLDGPGAKPPIAGAVAMIHTTRLWCVDWLRTLDPRAFEARALHPEQGELSVRTMLARCTWHLEHHAWFLSRKLERLLSS